MTTNDTFELRKGTSEDCRAMFKWSNDPTTREMSFERAEITWHEHVAWYEELLKSRRRHVFFAELSGEPVAVVRLHPEEEAPGFGVISLNVAPESRRKGVGTRCLEAATGVARELGYEKIHAYLRPENEASLALFRSNGYQEVARIHLGDDPALLLVKHLPMGGD